MTSTKDLKIKIGNFWSKQESKKNISPTRWWQNDLIVRHINQNICGEKLSGVSKGTEIELKKHTEGKKYQKAVSVGCGTAGKELRLIENDIVETFYLYEISEERIKSGTERIKNKKLEKRMIYSSKNAFKNVEKDSMDLVYWNNSLHHMFDTKGALEWSYNVLKPGGTIFIDDYAGPCYFQYNSETMNLAKKIRQSLPKKYLINPYKLHNASLIEKLKIKLYILFNLPIENSNYFMKTNMNKVDIDKLKELDPSETADSSNILAGINKFFPNAKIIKTGGCIYNLALNDIIYNFNLNNKEDRLILERLLRIDDKAKNISKYDNHYIFTLAKKT